MQFPSWSMVRFVVFLSALGLCSSAMCEEKQPDTDGLVEIFDGKTLDGWHAVPKDSAADWTVDDGMIVGQGSVDRQSFLVFNDEKLTDFELRLNYRLPGKGNTGVDIRLIPDKTGKRVFEAGPFPRVYTVENAAQRDAREITNRRARAAWAELA